MKKLSILAALWLLTACSSLGLAPAQSFDQKLAYAVGVQTSVRQSAADGVASNQLSVADGQAILKMTDDSRSLIDAAKLAADANNLGAANSKLALATVVLTQMQQYLKDHAK